MVSCAPAFSRFMLLPENASGFWRNIATSIWSSETDAGLFCAAILPSVSPDLTV